MVNKNRDVKKTHTQMTTRSTGSASISLSTVLWMDLMFSLFIIVTEAINQTADRQHTCMDVYSILIAHFYLFSLDPPFWPDDRSVVRMQLNIFSLINTWYCCYSILGLYDCARGVVAGSTSGRFTWPQPVINAKNIIVNNLLYEMPAVNRFSKSQK